MDDNKINLKSFFISIGLVILSGIIVPISFFTGFYIMFLLSVFAFSIATLSCIINGINMYSKHISINDEEDITYDSYEVDEVNYDIIKKIEELREQ